jgi:tetratricopeptide (TPR) repeat protein
MSSVGPINHIIQSVHNEVQQIADAAAKGGETISSSQAEKFGLSLQQKAEALQNEARGDFRAKAEGLDGKSLNRLSQAIASLGANSALARQLAKPSQYANLGNVLLSLGETIEKMKRKRQEVIFKKKGLKVERFEIIEFLNSTEKEFERFVAIIRERGADEDVLLDFIRELIKRMEILKYLHKISLEKKAKRLVESKYYKKLLKVIDAISEDERLRKQIYDISIDGETGMTHLRFWKTLKQMGQILDEL